MDLLTLTMPSEKPRRKSPAGQATTDLVLTAMRGNSSELFPEILSLYVPTGSRVADTTYGTGVFWRKVPAGVYDLVATDLQMGTDARATGHAAASFDAVIFDPPWMEPSSGVTYETEGLRAFEDFYANNKTNAQRPDKGAYIPEIRRLYSEAGLEAWRILKPGGVWIVKCQDLVHANKKWLLHNDILNAAAEDGFVHEDCFVLMRCGKPGVSRILRQQHARSNHSYFLVLRRPRRSRAR